MAKKTQTTKTKAITKATDTTENPVRALRAAAAADIDLNDTVDKRSIAKCIELCDVALGPLPSIAKDLAAVAAGLTLAADIAASAAAYSEGMQNDARWRCITKARAVSDAASRYLNDWH